MRILTPLAVSLALLTPLSSVSHAVETDQCRVTWKSATDHDGDVGPWVSRGEAERYYEWLLENGVPAVVYTLDCQDAIET